MSMDVDAPATDAAAAPAPATASAPAATPAATPEQQPLLGGGGDADMEGIEEPELAAALAMSMADFAGDSSAAPAAAETPAAAAAPPASAAEVSPDAALSCGW